MSLLVVLSTGPAYAQITEDPGPQVDDGSTGRPDFVNPGGTGRVSDSPLEPAYLVPWTATVRLGATAVQLPGAVRIEGEFLEGSCDGDGYEACPGELVFLVVVDDNSDPTDALFGRVLSADGSSITLEADSLRGIWGSSGTLMEGDLYGIWGTDGVASEPTVAGIWGTGGVAIWGTGGTSIWGTGGTSIWGTGGVAASGSGDAKRGNRPAPSIYMIWGTGGVAIWGTDGVLFGGDLHGIWGTGGVAIWGTGGVAIWGTGGVAQDDRRGIWGTDGVKNPLPVYREVVGSDMPELEAEGLAEKLGEVSTMRARIEVIDASDVCEILGCD